MLISRKHGDGIGQTPALIETIPSDRFAVVNPLPVLFEHSALENGDPLVSARLATVCMLFSGYGSDESEAMTNLAEGAIDQLEMLIEHEADIEPDTIEADMLQQFRQHISPITKTD